MKRLETIETLFDDASVREKITVMNKFEAMADDSRNDDWECFWCALDDFLIFGKRYKISVEELDD